LTQLNWRLWSVGYRDVEIKKIKIPPIRNDFDFKVYKNCFNLRSIVATQIGPHFLDRALPICDINDQHTLVHGLCSRVGFEHGRMPINLYRSLRGFVRRFIRRYLRPLPPGSVSFVDWLENTNYPKWRKDELTLINDSFRDLRPHKPKTSIKGFIKLEQYDTFKPARMICSRHDEFKCYAGPFAQAIEKQVFNLPYFIKHIPVEERPAFLNANLATGGVVFAETDYTRWESNFSTELLKACELQLYGYMMRHYPKEYSVIRRTLLGINKIDFNRHGVRAKIRATRMSGEMFTSLGNGFTNLMVFLWNCARQGIYPKGVVEGDDGLFALPHKINVSDINNLGLTLKIDYVNHFGSASFCGLRCGESLHVLRDPVKSMLKLGWTMSQYRFSKRTTIQLGLLRAKALSLYCEVPHCPVLGILARRVIHLTDTYKPIWDHDQYMITQYASVMKSSFRVEPFLVNESDRLLFSELYHIAPEQQILLENEFMCIKNPRAPYSKIVHDVLCPNKTHVDYFNSFVAYTREVPKEVSTPWPRTKIMPRNQIAQEELRFD